MDSFTSYSLRAVTAAISAVWILSTSLQAAPVQVVGKTGSAELRRAGKPYFVRGAGGDVRALAGVKAAGWNSICLWGDEGLGPKLDQAYMLGLTVCVGFWIGQIRQGFNWADARAVGAQRERLRAVEASSGRSHVGAWG